MPRFPSLYLIALLVFSSTTSCHADEREEVIERISSLFDVSADAALSKMQQTEVRHLVGEKWSRLLEVEIRIGDGRALPDDWEYLQAFQAEGPLMEIHVLDAQLGRAIWGDNTEERLQLDSIYQRISRELNAPVVQARVISRLALLALDASDHERLLGYDRDLHRILEVTKNPLIQAHYEYVQARALEDSGQFENARPGAASSAKLFSDLKLPRMEACATELLGMIEGGLGNRANAEAHFRAAINLYEKVGCQWSLGNCRGNLGQCLARQGRVTEAYEQLELAAQTLSANGSADDYAWNAYRIGVVAEQAQDVERAERAYGQAYDRIAATAQDDRIVRFGKAYARLAGRLGNSQRAFEVLTRVLDAQEQARDKKREKDLAELHVRYENEKRERAVDALQGAAREDRLRLENVSLRARHLTLGLGVLAVCVGFVTLLAFQLRRKNKELDCARLNAEQANESKSLFLARMTHELRTPLSGIIGITDLMDSGAESEKTARMVQTIRQSSFNLLRIIDDLLDFSRAERSKLNLFPQTVVLYQVLEDAANLLETRAKNKGLGFNVQIEGTLRTHVQVDSMRLTQIVLNLLGNAVKFTSHGHIEFSARARDIAEDRLILQLEICDTGIGIPETLRERLFTPFEQGSEWTNRRYGGSGLGLSLTRELVNLFDGHIDWESPSEGGTRFRVTLPLKRATAAPSTPLPSPDANACRRILVVDDDPIHREVLKELLLQFGCSCDLAEDGAEALERLRSFYYDAVLMDCSMPVMSGFTATREIRLGMTGAGSKEARIIGLSAHLDESSRTACLKAGMDEFLTKPIRAEDLCRILHLGPATNSANEIEKPSNDDFVKRQRAKLKASFQALKQKGLAEIHGFHELGKTQEVAFVAHRLRSGASYIGEEPFAAALERLEHAAEAGNHEAIAASLEEVRSFN